MFPEDLIESADRGFEESPRPVFGVSRFVAPEPEIYSPPKQRLWLHLLLLVLTLFTTTLVGAHMQDVYKRQPLIPEM